MCYRLPLLFCSWRSVAKIRTKKFPPPSEKYTFDIAVSDIRVADAVVTVTPSDALATYYCSVVKKADFDKLGSDEAYLDDDIDYLKAQAEKKQLTFKAYLETVIATGSEPIKFVTLEPSTDYYAYVYGITPEGRVTSDLKKTPFTTATPEPTEPVSYTHLTLPTNSKV